METKLKLSQIEVDNSFLPRDEYKKEEVEHYAECLKNGDILPPIVVFKKEDRFILASGRLRFEAHKLTEAIEIDVIVKDGSEHERIVESIESNAKHGLRLTNAEKRKCIKYFLNHPETQNWSNNSIGKKCGASHHLVKEIRDELFPHNQTPTVICERNGIKYEANTEKIGTSKSNSETTFQSLLDSNEINIVGALRVFRAAYENVELKVPAAIENEIESFVNWYVNIKRGVQ